MRALLAALALTLAASAPGGPILRALTLGTLTAGPLTGGLLTLGARPLAAATPEEVAQLWRVLEMPRVVAALRAEGLAYGARLDAEMLGGAGGARFAAAVSALYDAGAMQARGQAALQAALAATELGPVLDFYRGDPGRRAVAAEVAAREALLDPEIEAAARQQAQRLRLRDPGRWRQLGEFAAAGDLVEDNVAAAMSANLAFLDGLAAGGAPGTERDEAMILAEVWAQEAEVREATEAWVMAFLTLAAAPLDAGDLAAYTAFVRSGPGQRLNRALFAAFDTLFVEISHQLGVAVARELAGQDL